MNQVILSLLLQFITTPMERASFPETYEFYGGAELEYSNLYVWENQRTCVINSRSAEGGERRTVVSLNEKFQIVSDSSYGEDGALAYLSRYEYWDGKLSIQRDGSELSRFFYDGENLDSVSVTRNDTVLEIYGYAYDTQARPILIDHFYSKDGGSGLDHKRSVVSYFLPDSIVIKQDFIPVDRDSVRKTIYLMDGLPIKMAETEYFSGSIYRSTHVWTYPGASPIRHGAKRMALAVGNDSPRYQGYNLLGRVFREAR
jgi:hypothetical protein